MFNGVMASTNGSSTSPLINVAGMLSSGGGSVYEVGSGTKRRRHLAVNDDEKKERAQQAELVAPVNRQLCFYRVGEHQPGRYWKWLMPSEGGAAAGGRGTIKWREECRREDTAAGGTLLSLSTSPVRPLPTKDNDTERSAADAAVENGNCHERQLSLRAAQRGDEYSTAPPTPLAAAGAAAGCDSVKHPETSSLKLTGQRDCLVEVGVVLILLIMAAGIIVCGYCR